MLINAIYDSSVDSAPAGYKTAVQAAINYFDSLVTNNVTVNINFGWGEYNNGVAIPSNDVARSHFTGFFYSYAQVRNALVSHASSAADLAAVSTLPSSDPTQGGRFYVTAAEAVALGLQSTSSIIGYVGLNASDNFTFDPNNRAAVGANDAIGALEHEISEILGRVGYLGTYYPSSSNTYGVIDLFRYSSAGVLDTSSDAYFSVDGGKTLLSAFNDPTNGGDVADWISALKGDSFGTSYKGFASTVTEGDLAVMDLLGYAISGAAGTIQTSAKQGSNFYSTGANDTFIGTGGVNTVNFAGRLSEYMISQTAGGITVADQVSARDGTDSLVAMGQAKFKDYTLVFDLHSPEDTLVYELYQAAYARTPDNAGFRFWGTQGDTNNMSAISLADAFLSAPEFTQKYGANPSNAAYITALYTNVLGRTPDQGGLNYWIGVANSGSPHDVLLVAFATSGENTALIASHISNGYWTT